MQHTEQAIVLQLRKAEMPIAMTEQYRNFCRGDCHADVSQKRNCGQTSEEANYNENSADDLHCTYKGRHDLRRRDANRSEPAEAKFVWQSEFQDTFYEENPSDQQSDQ